MFVIIAFLFTSRFKNIMVDIDLTQVLTQANRQSIGLNINGSAHFRAHKAFIWFPEYLFNKGHQSNDLFDQKHKTEGNIAIPKLFCNESIRNCNILRQITSLASLIGYSVKLTRLSCCILHKQSGTNLTTVIHDRLISLILIVNSNSNLSTI